MNSDGDKEWIVQLDDVVTRLRKVEEELAEQRIFMAEQRVLAIRNSDILDDIRDHINKPFKPEWAAVGLGVIGAIGGLLYGTYLAPIESRVTDIEMEMAKREAYILDYQTYMKRMALAGKVEGEERPKE